MEMFNVHRRDIINLDDYMDLKKPGFGGPKSAKAYRDGSGKKVNTNPKLDGYQRVVSRHAAFGHPVYNSTYKAMSNDLVYKQERKKPYNYPDPYSNMGLPVVNVGKAANEGYSYTSFQQFINEEMEEYGMNPGGEQKIDLRGKTDLEAIGDAEEKMDSMRIDYADFFKSNDGKRVDYLDTDGDLIAYVDVPTRKLYVMPDAPTMSDEEYAKIYGTGETRREEEEEFEDDYEKYSPEEEEEMPSFSQSERSTEDIERKLKSFERGTSRPFEPGEEEEFEFEDED
jgi:hypothetical protein